MPDFASTGYGLAYGEMKMDIESMLILIALCLVSIPIAIVILFVRTSSLRRELASLREQLRLMLIKSDADAPSAPLPRSHVPDSPPITPVQTSQSIKPEPVVSRPEPATTNYPASSWS